MSDTSAFLALLVDAYTEARIEVEPLPPAGMRIHIPDNEPLEVDYADPIAQALEHPVETHLQLARQSVHGMMRLVREKGIPLGTHYPPLSDDEGRQTLLSAFAERDVDAHFTDPNTMNIVAEDGTTGTLNVGRHLAGVEGLEPGAKRERATEYVAGIAENLSANLDTPVSADQLRVRVYPEAAFPEGTLPQLAARPLTPDLWQVVVIDYPDNMRLLRRDQLGGMTDDQVFAAAVANSLREPFEVSEHDLGGTPLVHIGGDQPYVLSHLHVLDRYLGEAPHGALVVFPSPPVVMAHVLGRGNPVSAMEALQELAERYVADTDKPVTGKLYWWRPNPGSELPDLREVAIRVDHENKSISLLTADESFGPLLQSLMPGS